MDSPPCFYESDTYSPIIVDDLLKRPNDWCNIQDIVRLTFSTLSDVVRIQGKAIHNLERSLPLKVSKTELAASLSQKANITDLSELQKHFKTRVSGLQGFHEEKLTRSDIQYLLANKPSIDEVRSLFENKLSVMDFENQISLIKSQFENLVQDLTQKLIPNERELEFLHSQLKNKVSRDELHEFLKQKAINDRKNIKINNESERITLEERQIIDMVDLKKIFAALESKVEYSVIDKLYIELREKVDRSDFTQIMLPELEKKVEKYELDFLLKDLKKNLERKFFEHSSTTDAYLSSFKADLEQISRSVSSNLDKKLEIKDLERIYSKKSDLNSIVELIETVKIECREIASDMKRELRKNEDFDIKLETEVLKMKEQMQQVSIQLKDEMNIHIKNLVSNIKTEVQRDVEKLIEELRKTKEDLKLLENAKIDFEDFQKIKITVLDTQKGLDKVKEGFSISNHEFSSTLISLKEDLLNKQRTLETQVLENLSTKLSISEFPNLLSAKLHHTDLSKHSKALQNDLATLTHTIKTLQIDLSQKCNTSDLESHIKNTQLALEDVAKDMTLKCNLTDLNTNLSLTNKELEQLHNELCEKLSVNDFSVHISNTKSAIEALCSANTLGRWLWKSGELKNTNLVPWEIQSVNTAPDVFLLTNEKVSIVTVSAGIYELILGFYSRTKPKIQVLVNGEPVMSAASSSSNVVYSSGKVKPVTSNITGLTLIDFLALPARARVSIAFSCEMRSEGFISLKKL